MNTSLLKGSLFKGLLFFALPIFLSQLLQTLYNTVDTMLVGYCLGEQALAAMGATTALFDLIVGFCAGCANGFGIVLSQAYGRQDEERLRQSVAGSIVLSVVISLALTIVSYGLLPYILDWLQTPADLLVPALQYIRIIILGLVISICYNLAAAILRAVGNSKVPLVILGFSALLNIGLDVLCIVTWPMGIAGAALATVAAQAAATLACAVWILVRYKWLVPGRRDFRLQPDLVKNLFFQGTGMALMGSIVSAGSVILQSGINGLGTLVIAAHTAARRVFILMIQPLVAWMTALVTFVAQNAGAQNTQRIRSGIRISNRLAIGYSIVSSILAFGCGRQMIALISGSSIPAVLQNGTAYLEINFPFFFALGILINLRGSMQGLGYKRIPVLSSFIELFGKALFTWLLIPMFGYAAVCWCEPVIWMVMAAWLVWQWRKLKV